MIWLVGFMAVAGAVVPVVALTLVFRHLQRVLEHQRYLGDQNQQLIAALMATKNTPYAAAAATYVQPAEVDGGFEQIKVHEDAPMGTKLFGT